MIHGKKGQFFIASLVILGISTLIIFTYVQTTSYTQAANSGSSSELELQNYINVMEETIVDNPIPSDWFNTDWLYRRKFGATFNCDNIINTIASYGSPILPVPSEKLFTGDCQDELVLVEVSAPSTPIALGSTAGVCGTMSTSCFNPLASTNLYLYYGNKNANQGNGGLVVGISTTTILDEEKAIPSINCTFINQSGFGNSVDCRRTSADPQTYSFNFTTHDLTYQGTVN